MLTLKNTRRFIFGLLFCLLSAGAATAQTTAFTYQGRFTDSTVAQPTNGNYNMQFALFDAVSGGTQIGATVTNTSVQVTNGIFTVSLDYGANSFPGADRFLEIRVFSTTTNNYVVLSPRQQITSAPYAIRALKATTADTATNSTQLGGINANQFVTGQVVRSLNGLTDNVTLAPGSNIMITSTDNTLTIASTGGGGSGGILNQTTLQTGANFNIDGTGTANIFNAATQYNIGGSRILSNPGSFNLFVGVRAGNSNTVDGIFNSFVGSIAGDSNTTGDSNSFFGRAAGVFNTTGSSNSFFGRNAGDSNTEGNDNSFFGVSAGDSNTTGANNTLIGRSADVGSGGLTFATALGAGAVVRNNNAIVLGREDGSDTVRVFGLGAAGNTPLCRNIIAQISTCSSSLRYKTNIAPFSFGLSFINQLRPISFDWKEGGMKDVGFGAEDVAAINSLFVNYNAAGEVEGVKYDRLSAVFVNAFKEQQTQIEQQQQQIKQQQVLIDNLKKFVCQQNPQTDFCTEEK